MLQTLAAKQALADGVLDRRGDLGKIQFRGGRQALLSRIELLLAPSAVPAQAAPPARPKPADRALAFSQFAAETLGEALVRCEERYPLEGAHSVLFVVVEREAALWRERLEPAYRDLVVADSDPLAPTRLEVIDRATDQAMRRLLDAGLIAPCTRAIRDLGGAPAAGPPPLSEAEREKALSYRRQAERKLKMARLLAGGEMAEEEREALLGAALLLGRALAVENRVPEPAKLEEGLASPVSLFWGEALGAIRQFAAEPTAPAAVVVVALEKTLAPAAA